MADTDNRTSAAKNEDMEAETQDELSILDAIRKRYAVSRNADNTNDEDAAVAGEDTCGDAAVEDITSLSRAAGGGHQCINAAGCGEGLLSNEQSLLESAAAEAEPKHPCRDYGDDFAVSIPGAYAESPTASHSSSSASASSTEEGGGWLVSVAGANTFAGTSRNNNGGLVVATVVENELPVAAAATTDGVAASAYIRRSEKGPLLVVMMLFAGVAVVTAIITLCFMFLVVHTDDDQAAETTRVPTSAPTPTSLESQLLLMMMPETYDVAFAAHKEESEEETTYQLRALEWMLKDPNLESYMEEGDWRIRQRMALVALYFCTNGDQWTHKDHWLSYDHHECKWFARPQFSYQVYFVKFPMYNTTNPCGEGEVYQHLWLYDNGLSASLPEELYWLTNLKSVSLFDNSLTGTLSPNSMGDLTQLEGWSVGGNSLSGSLPSEMGLLTSVFFWNVFGNQLTGSIPTEIGHLSAMETLIIDFNQLTGTLPSEIESFSNLIMWYINFNLLTGSLPSPELGNLESLVDFHADFNQLSGPLPTELGILTSLKDIGVVQNAMTGTLPTQVGLLTTHLEVLELQDNMFSGRVPSELGAISTLTHFLAQNNRFSGTIPPEFVTSWSTSASNNLRGFNVTGNDNLLVENGGNNDTILLCWTNQTWYDTPECPWHYPTALSCWCNCACF